MKIINSISGGKTSSYIAMNYKADYNIFSVVCINHAPSRIKDVQMNNYINDKLSYFIPEFGEFIATAEDDKTLYAMRDLEQLMGSDMIWVRGKSFDDVLRTKNTHGGCPTRLPSRMLRYCTDEMKMVPIFKWWLLNIGEKVTMRIGFRSDEFDRMQRFFNANPNHFKFPIYSKYYGTKQMHHVNYNWRNCSFDLVREGIDKEFIDNWWEVNGFLGTDDLFGSRRHIEFPIISNCVGCPFKKEEIIAVMAHIQSSKIDWFSDQEELLDKGTWLIGNTYKNIRDNRINIAGERIFEYQVLGEACDSGGCSD